MKRRVHAALGRAPAGAKVATGHALGMLCVVDAAAGTIDYEARGGAHRKFPRGDSEETGTHLTWPVERL